MPKTNAIHPTVLCSRWRQMMIAVTVSVSAMTVWADRPEPAGDNLRPVIGVFSQQVSSVIDSDDISEDARALLAQYRYLIPASYVNWIGQAGGRVLPIVLDQRPAYYQELFALTNGLLFPGGNQGIDPDDIYTAEGELLWRLAKEANDQGDYYPIWGTCLGFEELAVLETGDGSVISQDVQATNLPLPLQLTPGARRSRLLRAFSPQLINALRTQAITFNSHEHGVTVEEFNTNPALNRFFTMLSFNQASNGPYFVSTMEAKEYPFYGTQWHPEKSNFEWSQNDSYSNLPHTPPAIAASQATANFLLSEARKSPHAFPEAQRDQLIYSAPLIYTGSNDWIYEQVYVFCKKGTDECAPQ